MTRQLARQMGAEAAAAHSKPQQPPELDQSEALARLRAVVESAVDGIITIDASGTIEDANLAAEQMFGYSRDELIGRNVCMLMPEPYRHEHDSYLANFQRTGLRKVIGIGREVQGHRKDGSEFPVDLVVSEMRLGGRILFTGIVRDITQRRQAEQALRVSEERFAAFMRYLPGAAWIKDLTGHYVYANPEAERVFNTGLKDLLGRTDHEIFPPETARQFQQNDRKAIKYGGNLQTIEILRHADGTLHHSVVNKFVVDGSDGRSAYVGGVAFDITDLHTAEEALRESEQRYSQLIQRLPAAIYTCDAEGRLTLYNDAAAALWGVKPVLGTKLSWMERVHPDDREQCLRTYETAFQVCKPLELEYRLSRAEGQYRWLHDVARPMRLEDGSFVGYIGSCTDVTERKRGEMLLRERVYERTRELNAANEQLQHQIAQRRRFESLLATENKILELMAANAALEELLNTICQTIESLIPDCRCVIRLGTNANHVDPSSPNGSVKQKPVSRATPGVDVFGSISSDVQPALCSEQMIVEAADSVDDAVAAEAYRKHGVRSFWLVPVRAATGKILGVLGMYCTEPGRPDSDAIDASAMASRLVSLAAERAVAEEKSREQMAHLAHVARLATIGEMASGLAHELNQPFCAIVNFAEASLELLHAEEKGSKELHGALAEVVKQAERAGEVIRRMREFVRRGEPKREPVDPNAVVREVAALTRVEARRYNASVRLKLGKQIPRVWGDPIQIQQVLVNLFRNGFEAMSDTRATKRVLTIHTLKRKQMVEIAVHDAGSGIADEIRDRLFEPFFTTKVDGMGMGLAICRSILEVHGGHIWAESNRRGGATIRFTMPTAGRKKRG